jgi:hypothetical protein
MRVSWSYALVGTTLVVSDSMGKVVGADYDGVDSCCGYFSWGSSTS